MGTNRAAVLMLTICLVVAHLLLHRGLSSRVHVPQRLQFRSPTYRGPRIVCVWERLSLVADGMVSTPQLQFLLDDGLRARAACPHVTGRTVQRHHLHAEDHVRVVKIGIAATLLGRQQHVQTVQDVVDACPNAHGVADLLVARHRHLALSSLHVALIVPFPRMFLLGHGIAIFSEVPKI